MTGSSILPATIHNNKIYFLFGKENELEDSSKGYSDFGGGVEDGETIMNTALREGSEELSGFLGDANTIQKHIQKTGGVFKLHLRNDYHVHIMFLKYDKNLPIYYNQNHLFLWKRMNQQYLNKSKLFEKIEIDWFSYDDLQKRRHEFRHFYKDVLDLLVENKSTIYTFLHRTSTRMSRNYKVQRSTKRIVKRNRIYKTKTKTRRRT
jgi:8-oxo-dGTP pyrophosphatase MutT (NUDIX family)